MSRHTAIHSETAAFTRRGFLRWLGAVGASGFAVSAGGIAYGLNIEPKQLVVEEITISLSRLPPAFEGLRIAQLSDLHLGPYVDAQWVLNAVSAANAAQPDIVVITGDLVAVSWRFMQPCLELLGQLVAPLGVYTVLGNHDYNVGNLEQTIAAVRHAGLRLLRNQFSALVRGTSKLYFVGLDDWSYGQTNIKAAVAKIPSGACKIALMHEPDVAELIAEADIDLQLSGHSHGGQVRIPGVGPLMLPRYGSQYPMGLARVGQFTQIYTNRGIGLTPPAIRLNCPPEVTLIRLTGPTA